MGESGYFICSSCGAVRWVKMERKFRISQLIDILNFTIFSAPPDPAENNLIAKQIKIAKLKFKAQKFKSLDEVYDAIKCISRSQASAS